MDVNFYRGATVSFSDGNRKLICDPWLIDGIYYGAWAHYPAYTEEDWARDKPEEADYIYISHIHPDHFDPVTLGRLKKDKKVIIHSFVSKFLKRKIEALGFEVIELENGAAFEIAPNFRLRVFAADNCDPSACSSFFKCGSDKTAQIDSMGIIEAGNIAIANINDCPWGLGHKLARQLGHEYRIEAACLAHGLAGAFPQCYDLPDDFKAECAEKRMEQSLKLMLRWMVALRTYKVLPFAAGYQLCGKLAGRNKHRGIPPPEMARDVLMDVGAEPICNFTILDGVDAYITDVLSKRKLDYEMDPMPEDQEVLDLLPAAYKRLNAKRKELDYRGKATVHIRLNDKRWFVIPPIGDPFYREKGEPVEPYVEIETDPRLLSRLLSGPSRAHWNNAEIGSHLTFNQHGPGDYGLSLLMSSFHA